MENRQMTPFFSSNFSTLTVCICCLYHSFLNLKILKIYFHKVPPMGHSGLKNTSILKQKLLNQIAHYTFLESRHLEVTKNLYYGLSTRQSQITKF